MSLRRNNFKLAYRSLQAAKARNFLTMLGIIIGVMAVILMVCVGQGVKKQISGQLGRYGENVLSVQPGTVGNSTALVGGLSGASSALLTENDLRTVEKTKDVAYSVPLATATGSVTGDHRITSPFIVATSADFPQVIKQSLASGDFFDSDIDSKTVVLGQTIAQKLFDDNAPLGQGLVWRGERFIVGGVFDDFHAPPLSLEANFNNAIFLPYSTAQERSGNILGIYQILAKADTGASLDAVVSRVNAALISAHGGSHDVTVEKAGKSNLASDQTIHLLTLLIGVSALTALVVGGIGIMDVMLVSVTERMHEIGIRKAIGATNQQILRQFMAEAFVLSTFGAIIGVVLSVIAVGLLRAFSSLQPVLVWQIMVLAPLVAIATGLFFGGLPALKAARKDPIEALRHE